MQGPRDRIWSQNAAIEHMRNNKLVQYISARHQRLYNKREKANMVQNIYAGALPGNDESAGFIKSYSKETLCCSEMSPYPPPHVQDSLLISFTNFNAQFLYSLTICMILYNPRHVSSINMPIVRRTNCIITASGIVTLCTAVYRE